MPFAGFSYISLPCPTPAYNDDALRLTITRVPLHILHLGHLVTKQLVHVWTRLDHENVGDNVSEPSSPS
jgi:hypothetical protein